MKKIILLFVVWALACCFFYERKNLTTIPFAFKNSAPAASATFSSQRVVQPISKNRAGSLPPSLFSKMLEQTTSPPISFLSEPPAPLQELSEQEASDFPGAHVAEYSEAETPDYHIRQRLLATSFKYPYLKTEELIDRATGKLVARLEMVANQFLVLLPDEADPAQFLQQLGPQALFMTRISESKPIYRVALRDASLASLPAALETVQKNSLGKISGEPDHIVHGSKRPRNYAYGYQWGLWKTNHFNSFEKAYQPLMDQYFYYLNHYALPAPPEEPFGLADFESLYDVNFLSKQKAYGCSQKNVPDPSLFEVADPNAPMEAADYFSSERGMNAEDAWDIRTSAGSLIVAVVDTGIRYTHANLKNNMWHNPNPDPGLHDLYGKNFITNSGDPMDDNGHGTHCAGSIGGCESPTLGIAGVAWNVQLMACKCLDQTNSGSQSDAISALDYAAQHHANLINCSFSFAAYECISGPRQGSISSSQGVDQDNLKTFKAELASLRDQGIIVIAAAGNNGKDMDLSQSYNNDYDNLWLYQFYPACFSAEFENVVSVAATDYFQAADPKDREGLASFSNYGARTVSLAAPGSFILSTYDLSDQSYAFSAGTSMAAPFVTGALALMQVAFPTFSYQELIQHLIETTDPLPTLQGKMRGGRLNIARALQPPSLTPPPPGVTAPPPVIRSWSGPDLQDPTYWWY